MQQGTGHNGSQAGTGKPVACGSISGHPHFRRRISPSHSASSRNRCSNLSASARTPATAAGDRAIIEGTPSTANHAKHAKFPEGRVPRVPVLNCSRISRSFAPNFHLPTPISYTDSIGQALLLIGADQTLDVTNVKPEFTAKLDAGQVTLGWAKQGLDGTEFWADRGDGKGFLFLSSTVPTCPCSLSTINSRPSTSMNYKAIYRRGDDRVGQWSDVVSIPVAG